MGEEDAKQIAEKVRTYSDWGSIRGLNQQILPWRLYEKSKKFFWDPAGIDFTQDADQWAKMSIDQRVSLYGLATGFMVGEEGVTLGILPLVMAISDEGRTDQPAEGVGDPQRSRRRLPARTLLPHRLRSQV